MGFQADNVGTFILTNESITIIKEWGVTKVAIKMISGVGNYSGTMKLGNRSSVPIPLVVNDPVVWADDDVIDGLTIDCTGVGVIDLLTRR